MSFDFFHDGSPFFVDETPILHGEIGTSWLLEMCQNPQSSWEIIKNHQESWKIMKNHQESWKIMKGPRSSQGLPPFFPKLKTGPVDWGRRPDHRLGGRGQRFLCGAVGGAGGRRRSQRQSSRINGTSMDNSGIMIGLSTIRDYQLSNWGNNSSLLWIIQGSLINRWVMLSLNFQ